LCGVCVCVCDLYFLRWILVQRWAGRPIWLRSAEASVERWSPPFCGIRTSVVCWLSNQSVGSPVPRQKKRAGYGVLGCSLLQPLWDRHWGGPGRWCFWPPAFGGWRGDWLVWGPQQTWCVCVFVCVQECEPQDGGAPAWVSGVSTRTGILASHLSCLCGHAKASYYCGVWKRKSSGLLC
jgi:hypothetical protein